MRQLDRTDESAGRLVALTLTPCSAAEEEPRLLGTVENKLGLSDWLKQQGHEWVGQPRMSADVL
jgi:formate dehydrogenase